MRSSCSGDDASVSDDRLFEWVDGPLVVAMLRGESFLLDEISLADDAVLERLNSLLEPERQICLAERCGGGNENNTIVAAPSFRFFATMNPGGDYAKKELSSALRNRFTEIWCPSLTFLSEVSYENDWEAIVLHNLHRCGFSDSQFDLKALSEAMVNFCRWFAQGRSEAICGMVPGRKSGWCRRPPPTIRDLLAWVDFMQNLVESRHDFSRAGLINACLHGAALIFLDSLETCSQEMDMEYIFARTVDYLQPLQSATGDWFGFSAAGGINYLLRCILLSSGKNEHESSNQLLGDISLAAMKFVASLNLQPGHCVPELKDSNKLYGCEPFFIATGEFLFFLFVAPLSKSIRFISSGIK